MPGKRIKCKFCTFSTTDRKEMARHLKNNHSFQLRGMSHTPLRDDDSNDLSAIETALDAFIVVESLSSNNDDSSDDVGGFSGGGGSFDGGGSSDSYASYPSSDDN